MFSYSHTKIRDWSLRFHFLPLKIWFLGLSDTTHTSTNQMEEHNIIIPSKASAHEINKITFTHGISTTTSKSLLSASSTTEGDDR